MTLFEKICRMVGDRRLPAPKMPSIRLVRIGFANRHVTTIVVMAMMISGAAVSVGLWFAVKDIANASWDWPEAGAGYALPQQMGEQLAPYEDGTESHTLQINLAAGVRLSTLTLNNLDLGKAGLTDCVTIQRTTNTTGWLYVDSWVMTGVSAPSLDFANIETGNLVLRAYTDGHSMDATLDATITDVNVISTRGSGEFLAQNSVVDRVIIEIHGDATIGTLTMTDVACSVGGFNVDFVKAGSITMDATSKFGDGDGINTSDYVINSSVKARTITDNLIDTPITVR